MGDVTIDPVLVAEAVQDQVVAVAQVVAEATASRAKDHLYARSVRVVETAEGARVTSFYPFAHLDEFGSINNSPTAAMRSSAAEHGRFEPAGKP